MTTVLGLDLSYASTGVGVIDYDTGEYVRSGVLAPVGDSLGERLDLIASRTLGWIDTSEPIEIAIETPIAYRSGTTTIRLGMVHGAVLAAMARRGLDPHQVSVGEVKRHATGAGNATKVEMIAAAERRWPIGRPFTNDEADALWIADLARIEAHKNFDNREDNDA